MNQQSQQLSPNKRIRVIGFDDAPFNKHTDHSVNVSGIVCSETRFEGMLWFDVTRDGMDATDRLLEAVKKSKFDQQLHAILLDGIAFGGFNVVDIHRINAALSIPCITVMRKVPDLPRIQRALNNLNESHTRWRLIQSAGTVHKSQSRKHTHQWCFQAAGCTPSFAVDVLDRTTDTGHVPEALRLAHLIGSAIKTGQSSNRA